MMDSEDIRDILARYDRLKLRVGTIASHSALDICDGAIEEGFPTVAYAQRGRERTYSHYFASMRSGSGRVHRGMVDKTVVVNSFSDILANDFQEQMRRRNVIFIPNRSFTSYLPLHSIEDDFRIPIFGSRPMLRIEDRGEAGDYYDLLEKGGLPTPPKINDPGDIEDLTIVKLHHAQKPLERGFFTCSTADEYYEKSESMIANGIITEDDLAHARMEKYIIGPVFNLDFFHSPLNDDGPRLELLGVDWRFESSLDGHVRLPAAQQLALSEHQKLPEMTVVGHDIATLRESLLERAFDLGEKFIDISAKIYENGIIGPFCLQTCVDQDMNFVIYDVAPRVGGGTNAHMNWGHPYGNSLWRRPMSSGRRVALELRRAAEADRLSEVLS